MDNKVKNLTFLTFIHRRFTEPSRVLLTFELIGKVMYVNTTFIKIFNIYIIFLMNVSTISLLHCYSMKLYSKRNRAKLKEIIANEDDVSE